MMKLIDIYNSIRRRRIREGYSDLPLEYFLEKAKKLDAYSGYKDKLRKGGFVFLHFPIKDDWHLYGDIKVFNEEDGTEVANSTYGKQYEYSDLKGAMDVRPDFRRKKIATMMYDWIEELVGDTMKPDLPHSKSAEQFWKNRIKK